MTKYTCEGCGKTYEGAPEQAFLDGWDTPERFMSFVTCNGCPISETIWWRVAVLHEQPTPEEAQKLNEYYKIWEAANPELAKEFQNGNQYTIVWDAQESQ
jgi:predicted metal-binding protein